MILREPFRKIIAAMDRAMDLRAGSFRTMAGNSIAVVSAGCFHVHRDDGVGPGDVGASGAWELG